MNELDVLLFKCWNRINLKVHADPKLALRRSRRRFKGVLTRPMREWCLALRASDTRIISGEHAAMVDPVANVSDASRDPVADLIADPVANHQPHVVTLSGSLIRRLTQPVRIAWPGVTYREAARLRGREWKTMRTWARQGMFRIDYYREFGFPEDTTRSRPRKDLGDVGRGGRPRVWTPSPIDPNVWTGRNRHSIFGTLWQWGWQSIPERYELKVRREPRWHVRRGVRVFRGWEFVCPGRVAHDGTLTRCGRRCTHLYFPQTVWTLQRSMGEALAGPGLAMPEDSGLAGLWSPGVTDTVARPWEGEKTRRFACRKCWRIRNTCFAEGSGWNEFIAHMTGGLLYGHDVPRPLDLCPVVRRKRSRYQAADPAASKAADENRSDCAAATRRSA